MQTIPHSTTPEILDTEAQLDIQPADGCAELSTHEMDSVAGGPFVMND